MESQPKNPEFRINHETFTHGRTLNSDDCSSTKMDQTVSNASYPCFHVYKA